MFVKFCTVMGTVTTVPAVQAETLPSATVVCAFVEKARNVKAMNKRVLKNE
jgi:hypothetical protein